MIFPGPRDVARAWFTVTRCGFQGSRFVTWPVLLLTVLRQNALPVVASATTVPSMNADSDSSTFGRVSSDGVPAGVSPMRCPSRMPSIVSWPAATS